MDELGFHDNLSLVSQYCEQLDNTRVVQDRIAHDAVHDEQEDQSCDYGYK